MTQTAIAPANPADRILEVLVSGNLSVLSAPERLDYFNRVCASLGLNPLTKPLEFITLNNKLVLYATKACTDQLRQLHQVSVEVTDQKQVGDLYMVTVTATDKTGRMDSDMGVVSTARLQGENLANAILKAVTKAKRRVTLSICGLGMLDETEVADIPASAKRPPVVMPQSKLTAPVDIDTGELHDAAPEVEPTWIWFDDLKEALNGAPIRAADVYEFLGVADSSNRDKCEAIDAWLNPAIGEPRKARELVNFVADQKARAG